MEDTGFIRCTGSLDPRAREFVPVNMNPFISQKHVAPPLVHPQFYYPYPCEVQVLPFSTDAGGSGSGVEYPPARFTAAPPPTFQISDQPVPVPLPPPILPPPSTTPSRTLLLSSVPTDVSESTVRRELEVFGDVRAVQMERIRDGLVTVHFYDLRDAESASAAVQEQHIQHQYRLRKHYEALFRRRSAFDLKNLSPPLPPPARGLISGRAVWAHSIAPGKTGVPNCQNQGTIIVFNLDPEISTSRLREIFEAFGPVKELRGTPLKRHQRFVEFYDVRHAAKALADMNGEYIQGHRIVIEFSRPGGGQCKRLLKSAQNEHHNLNSIIPNFSTFKPPPLLLSISPCKSSSARPQAQSSSAKKLGFIKGSSAGNCGSNYDDNAASEAAAAALRASIASMRIDAASKNSNKTTKHKKDAIKTLRQYKGSRPSRDFDGRFLIDGEAIMESNCRDSRTTVMIKNIPNKYSQKLILNMLDNHCIHCNEQIAKDDGDDQPLSSYDFVYLPIDFINKCNVGYGFVNMTSPEATWRLYKAFHRQNWEVFNSRKICEVTYARLQGVEALKEHFKNSKFPCEAQEYLPVVFSPPRDGRLLAEPVPIVITRRPPFLSSSSPTAASSLEDESEVDNNDDLVEDDDEEEGGLNGGDLAERKTAEENSCCCSCCINDDDGDEDQDD